MEKKQKQKRSGRRDKANANAELTIEEVVLSEEQPVQNFECDFYVEDTHEDTDEKFEQPVNGKSYAWTNFDKGDLKSKIDIGSHNILNLGTNPVMKDDMFVYFEELMNFIYYDFAKENQFIQLNVNGEDYIYKIFSVNFLKVFDVNKFSRSGYDDETVEFLDMLDNGNYYNYDVDVTKDDKLISLYTCTRFFGKDLSLNFVVTGRLLRDDEKVELSNVEKTEKYDEIVQILEGGEEDE